MSAPELVDSVHIAASPERVWALVSDVRRMPDWSPQVDSTRLRDGLDRVGPGVRFTNRNSDGELVWTTHAEVVRFEPERDRLPDRGELGDLVVHGDTRALGRPARPTP